MYFWKLCRNSTQNNGVGLFNLTVGPEHCNSREDQLNMETVAEVWEVALDKDVPWSAVICQGMSYVC